jgi:hypothetical protein
MYASLFEFGPLDGAFVLLAVGLLIAATVFKGQPRKAGYCYIALIAVVLIYAAIQAALLILFGL